MPNLPERRNTMQHYAIVLDTDTGGRRTIRINHPNPNMPVEDIQDAVDRILDNDVFDPQRGALKGLNRMELTTVQRTQVL